MIALTSICWRNYLSKQGHSVVRPADVGLTGKDDDVHLSHAIQHELIVVTKDPDDFQKLHLQNPNHHGVFDLGTSHIATTWTETCRMQMVAAISRTKWLCRTVIL